MHNSAGYVSKAKRKGVKNWMHTHYSSFRRIRLLALMWQLLERSHEGILQGDTEKYDLNFRRYCRLENEYLKMAKEAEL